MLQIGQLRGGQYQLSSFIECDMGFASLPCTGALVQHMLTDRNLYGIFQPTGVRKFTSRMLRDCYLQGFYGHRGLKFIRALETLRNGSS